jgi:hypothetical protein
MRWTSRSTVESEGEIASTFEEESYLVLHFVAVREWLFVASIHSRVNNLCCTLAQSCSRDRRPDLKEAEVLLLELLI